MAYYTNGKDTFPCRILGVSREDFVVLEKILKPHFPNAIFDHEFATDITYICLHGFDGESQ